MLPHNVFLHSMKRYLQCSGGDVTGCRDEGEGTGGREGGLGHWGESRGHEV